MDIHLRINELRAKENLSKKDFSAKIGVDNSQYGKIEAGKLTPTIQQIMDISSIFEVSTDWLINGNGSMLKETGRERKKTPFYDTEVEAGKAHPSSDISHLYKDEQNKELRAIQTEKGIPLIPLDAFAGFGTDNSTQVFDYECEKYVIPNFKGAEFLIQVRGSSMYPKYSSGDIVACKKLPLDTFFQWNKVYVIDTDQGVLIKRVKKSVNNEYITLVSENEKYEAFEVHRSGIYSLAIVVGVIRLE